MRRGYCDFPKAQMLAVEFLEDLALMVPGFLHLYCLWGGLHKDFEDAL